MDEIPTVSSFLMFEEFGEKCAEYSERLAIVHRQVVRKRLDIKRLIIATSNSSGGSAISLSVGTLCILFHPWGRFGGTAATPYPKTA